MFAVAILSLLVGFYLDYVASAFGPATSLPEFVDEHLREMVFLIAAMIAMLSLLDNSYSSRLSSNLELWRHYHDRWQAVRSEVEQLQDRPAIPQALIELKHELEALRTTMAAGSIRPPEMVRKVSMALKKLDQWSPDLRNAETIFRRYFEVLDQTDRMHRHIPGSVLGSWAAYREADKNSSVTYAGKTFDGWASWYKEEVTRRESTGMGNLGLV